MMVGYAIFLFFFIFFTRSAPPQQQLVTRMPGYPSDYTSTHRVWAGYLDTSSSQRTLHYVFMESLKEGKDNSLPVLLWMNGGPGCSSKLGLLQEIPPYFLPLNTPYISDMKLPLNTRSWLNLTNILFIDSPAGVGYSINTESNYKYNDINTAKDNLIALTNFFKKFDNYRKNYFIIAGQSYAGKYIPDLAVNIDNYNALNPSSIINLKGLMIGNGVIDFQDGSLEKSQIQFMITHNLIDKKLIDTYQRSCMKDSTSAGCEYFNSRYDDLVKYIDPYNIYGPCFDEGTKKLTQRDFLKVVAKQFGSFYKKEQQLKNWIQELKWNEGCSYDKGVQDYFSLPSNVQAFHSKVKTFKVCNEDILMNYQKTPSGSISQLSRIISQNKLKVYLFSGDWDDVVPFTDTLKNLDKLSLKQQGRSQPWSVDGQHAGFIRKYTQNFKFFLVKGAGHEAPQYQRERTYAMLQKFLDEL